MRAFTLLIATALVLLSAPGVRALTMEIEASEIVTIQPADSSKSPRILVKWSLPAPLSGKIVDGATISITLSHEADEPFAVDAFRVTASWSAATATWSDGWTEAGGDFDAARPSPALVTQRNGGKVGMDVHRSVLDHIAGKADNYGFILVADPKANATLSPISANAAARLADAKLIIAYRKQR